MHGGTDGSHEEGWTWECILGTVASCLAGAALLVYLKRRRRQRKFAASEEVASLRQNGQGVADDTNARGQVPNGVPRTLSGRSYGRADSRHSSGSDSVERRRVAFAREGHTESGLRQAPICHLLKGVLQYVCVLVKREANKPLAAGGLASCGELEWVWFSEQSVEAASEFGGAQRSPMTAGPSRLLSARHGSFGEVGVLQATCP